MKPTLKQNGAAAFFVLELDLRGSSPYVLESGKGGT